MIDSSKYINIYINKQKEGLKEATIKRKMQFIRFFFEYLDSKGVNDLTEIDKMMVYNFISSKTWRPQTKSVAQFVFREFFNYMKEENITQFDGYDLFPVVFTNKRDSILSYFTEDEIKKMIDSIDLSQKCGVRDKCMITLAAHTGLRASDIIFLKYNEIEWDKNLISKVQRKTNIKIDVPFTNQIKFLLIDYLKNHRPAIDSEYIFINTTTNLPFKDAKILTNIVRSAFIKANIDAKNKKIGAHSLRHSLATNMLKNNTPLSVIKDVLGHTTITTTEKYISIDIEGLRQMCLEVPNYE